MCDFTCVLFPTQCCNAEGSWCGFMGYAKVSREHRGFSIDWLIPDQEFRGEKCTAVIKSLEEMCTAVMESHWLCCCF